MTPLTKEQAEALADRIEAYARQDLDDDWVDGILLLNSLAAEIRDGTFIEVQHD